MRLVVAPFVEDNAAAKVDRLLRSASGRAFARDEWRLPARGRRG